MTSKPVEPALQCLKTRVVSGRRCRKQQNAEIGKYVADNYGDLFQGRPRRELNDERVTLVLADALINDVPKTHGCVNILVRIIRDVETSPI